LDAFIYIPYLFYGHYLFNLHAAPPGFDPVQRTSRSPTRRNLLVTALYKNSSVVHFRTYTLAPALSVDVPPNRMPTIMAEIVLPASSCTPLRFGKTRYCFSNTIAQGWMEKIPGVPEREALVNS